MCKSESEYVVPVFSVYVPLYKRGMFSCSLVNRSDKKQGDRQNQAHLLVEKHTDRVTCSRKKIKSVHTQNVILWSHITAEVDYDKRHEEDTQTL